MSFLSSIFGGGGSSTKSSTQANTTVTTDSSIGSGAGGANFGLTGQDAVSLAAVLGNSVNHAADSILQSEQAQSSRFADLYSNLLVAQQNNLALTTAASAAQPGDVNRFSWARSSGPSTGAVTTNDNPVSIPTGPVSAGIGLGLGGSGLLVIGLLVAVVVMRRK